MKIVFGVAVLLIAIFSLANAQDVRGLQDRWMQCLKSSFKINKKHQPDANLAAEGAFQACATEEDELWQVSASAGVPRSSFAHLKSATKEILVRGK